MEDNAPSQKDERIMTQSPASPHLKSYRELTGFMNGRLMTGKKQKKRVAILVTDVVLNVYL